MDGSLRCAMVAGEASGDLLGGELIRGLQQRWPALNSFGIGGAHMSSQGFDAWWPSDRLAVRGYVEALPRLPELLWMRRRLATRLMQQPHPNVFVGVDAPDFNFDLEHRLKQAGIPTVHFVAPSFWAWRPKKVEKLKRSVDHVLCIFPFEPALLAEQGVASTFVGHPLAQRIPLQPDRAAARQQLGLSETAPVIALLPGSRVSEVHYLAQRFLDAAQLLRQAVPAAQFVLPALASVRHRLLALGQASGLAESLKIVDGQSHTALAACDVTLIASGTATLEAALFKRPMVIAYNMHPLSYRLMRRKQRQPWVGLPNILSREFVVPELLQDEATPHNLAAAVLDWLHAPARVSALQLRFTDLHHSLRRDTARLSIHAIEKVLGR